MGLSFLNKKIWHPGSFANIEKVWIAEQKHREVERKAIENAKKIKEEKAIEELKKIQVEHGLIPASHLNRLDFIYQGPECTSTINTAEEFLLGKSLNDEKSQEKKHFTPVFQESYSNPQNEVFTRVHEDPMYLIMKEEMKQRKEIEENPYQIKVLLQEIEEKERRKNKKKEKRKHRHHHVKHEYTIDNKDKDKKSSSKDGEKNKKHHHHHSHKHNEKHNSDSIED